MPSGAPREGPSVISHGGNRVSRLCVSKVPSGDRADDQQQDDARDREPCARAAPARRHQHEAGQTDEQNEVRRHDRTVTVFDSTKNMTAPAAIATGTVSHSQRRVS